MKQFKKKKNDDIKHTGNNNSDNVDEKETKWYSLNDLTIYGAGMLLAAVGLYISNVNVKKRNFRKSKDVRINKLSSIRKEITHEPLSRDTLLDISKLIELDETKAIYLPTYKKALRDLLAPGQPLKEEDKKVEKILQRLKDNEDEDQLPMYIYRKIMEQKHTGALQESMGDMVLAYAHYTQERINFHLHKEYDHRYFDPGKEVVDNWHREEAKRRYSAIMRKNGYEVPDTRRKSS